MMDNVDDAAGFDRPQKRMALDGNTIFSSLRRRLDVAQQRWNSVHDASEHTLEALVQELDAIRRGALHLCKARKGLEASWSPSSLLQIARDRLCLLLLQMGQQERATEHLASAGYFYRLSDCVLKPASSEGKKPSREHSVGHHFIGFIDDALPEDIFADLQRCFSPEAEFWEEHNYWRDERFFSYELPLNGIDSDHPALKVSLLIAKIAAEFAPNLVGPDCEPGYAEWWCHSKPHCAGHLLHFDQADDGQIPKVSTVLYLSDEGVGGPTLVTAQSMTDTHLASRGWLCSPKKNRLLLFDGSLLHGVIPGAGVCAGGSQHRCTLMVALYQRRPRRGERHGLPMPQPTGSTRWLSSRFQGYRDQEVTDIVSNAFLQIPEALSVWVDVDYDANSKAGCNIANCPLLPAPTKCFQGITPWRAIPDRLLLGEVFE